MNAAFFSQVESGLAPERLEVYRQDGVSQVIALARYLYNMALCESLYSPLQISEIALRNAIHDRLTSRYGTEYWFNSVAPLSGWQQRQVNEACQKLLSGGKPITPGRMVAELHFGFWTGFFNKAHAGTGLGHTLARQVVAYNLG
jgi:hypothetical protein